MSRLISAEDWLEKEDNQTWNERLNRLKWSIREYPNIDSALLFGGSLSFYLFEEARCCFIFGQYIATTMLSLSFIEHVLANYYFSSGKNDIQKASIGDLLVKAKAEGFILKSEFTLFDKVRRIRNPLAHFRKPGHKDTLEMRMIKIGKHPYEILEDDAKIALKATFRMMSKFALPMNDD